MNNKEIYKMRKEIDNFTKDLGSISIQKMMQLSYHAGFVAGMESLLNSTKKGGDKK